MKVMHLACVHKSNDSRILIKECCSLAKAGHEVVYYTSTVAKAERVSQSNSDNVKIKFHELDWRGVVINRQVIWGVIARRKNKKKLVQIIEAEKPDVLHIHELELMYIIRIIKLRFPQIVIIYDVHEDNAEQYAPELEKILGKRMGSLFQRVIEKFDMQYVSRVDGVITVTPYLFNKLSKYNSNITEIRNMPSDINRTKNDINEREAIVCYCGGITEERGISTLCDIVPDIHGKVLIAGPIIDNYLNILKTKCGDMWGRKISYLGYLGRTEINELYSHAVVGLCTLKYNRNIYHAYPIKMFEYMAAGVPVICSNFPLWEEIIKEENCGITVDPEDDKEILRAINSLLDNRELAQKMADSGKRAIQNKYNWEIEEAKLLDFYQKIERK